MKGFIETINKIKEICISCESCAECPLATHYEHRHYCYFDQEIAHDYDANEILDCIAKWKGGAAHD